ncbi:cation:proton antiporter [Desulfurivibrio sp. C05AmB]|uniref:cation:proton antiporter domain-containing protein n=1 Tax=Desulfurivibrio sp. C05AmB TaxID=3374371 RepID=UPI00376EA3B9
MEPISVLSAYPVTLSVAFLLGFIARQVGLPPLVGFLVAGFLFNAFGVESDSSIEIVADLGVTLLLFTIGLKLKIKNLTRPEVWAGATGHALITVLVFGLAFTLLGLLGIQAFAGLDLGRALLIGFALCFSSTVFAVKILEEKGEMLSLHGRTAIGILIMQDVFAVLFLTASTGKLPSLWALPLLVALVLVRPGIYYILNRCGHGELLPMFGLFAALAIGVASFDLVGLKPDLGALVIGMLLANNKRASEIADNLFSLKELFLVGFFVQIGLAGLPTWHDLGIAFFLVLLVPLKVALFFLLLTRLRMRARSSFLASLSLANYSEFGLIVGAVGVSNGWMDSSWMLIIAIALSISFVAAAPLNQISYKLFNFGRAYLKRYEGEIRHPEETIIDLGESVVAIFGMGRVGSGAYDFISGDFGDLVVGVESNANKVVDHHAKGRRVVHGDATDPEFWARTRHGRLRMVLLAMPEHHANLYALRQLKETGFSGFIAALAQFPDEAYELEEAGAQVAFNLYEGAGAGFAAQVEPLLAEMTGGIPRQKWSKEP